MHYKPPWNPDNRTVKCGVELVLYVNKILGFQHSYNVAMVQICKRRRRN